MSSRHSPYRRNIVNHNQQNSIGNREQVSRLTQKSRLGRSRVSTQYTPDKKAMDGSYLFRVTQHKRNQSQVKIETLLDHNKYLLSQNCELSSLVAERGQIILAIEEKLQQQMNQEVRTLEEIQYQKNRFIQEFKLKTQQNDRRIQELLEEIGCLHDQIYSIDMAKQKEIHDLKVNFSIQNKRQIESLLNTHHKTTELMQLEINQLRQHIEHNQSEKSETNHQFKAFVEKNRTQINGLNEQINHLHHIKRLQISQQKVDFQNTINTLAMKNRKELEVTVLNYQMELKKVRNQLNVKKIETHQLLSQVQVEKIETQTKEYELVERRTQLESEMLEVDRRNKEILFREKSNLKKTNESELCTANATHKAEVQHLLSEIQKLKSVNAAKNEERNDLIEQIEKLRNAKNQQIHLAEKMNQALKQTMTEMKQDNQQDEEAFKTKMANLHFADIESLRNYYENQIAVMLQDLQNREQAINENRQKVHKQIQEKAELRKVFENEVSILKVRIGQLEVKFSDGVSERRQQHANMNSKIQLTSMNLIRETNQKEKFVLFYEQERKKLQTLIITKDSEIANLQEKTAQLKKDYQQQILERQETISLANKKCDDLERSLKKEQLYSENEVRKKDGQNGSDRRFYEGQIERLKQEHSEEYASAVKQLTVSKTSLEAQRNQLLMTVKELKAELYLTKEHREQEGLDMDITLQEEKNRLISEKGLLEVSLKNFYETQIRQKNQEIKDLGQQLQEKEEDVREQLEKYHKLEKKLNQLLHSQEKLRDIENKVMAVGEENSTIKTLAEVLRTRRKG